MNTDTLKIIESLIMPIVLLVLGVWVKQIAGKHEKRASLHERIIEKRIAVYEQIGTELNDVYAFLMQVGHWKELNPDQVLNKKRQIDKIMYINKPFWSEAAFSAFIGFMQVAFITYNKVGEDAKFRCDANELPFSPLWQDDWVQYFIMDNNNPSSKSDIVKSYQHLMREFARDFGHYLE